MKKIFYLPFISIFILISCNKSAESIDVSKIKSPCDVVDAMWICCQDAKRIIGDDSLYYTSRSLKISEKENQILEYKHNAKMSEIKPKLEKIESKMFEIRKYANDNLHISESNVKDCVNFKKVEKVHDAYLKSYMKF